MNKITAVQFLAFVLSVSVFAGDSSIGILQRKGLKGKVSIVVKDAVQHPVEGAVVHFLFENGHGEDGYQKFLVTTDKNGKASAEGRIRISVIVSIQHKGYHWLHKEYQYITTDESYMEGDKWRPYERIIPLTLLEKRNRAEANTHFGQVRFPLSTNNFKVFLRSRDLGKPGLYPSSSDIGHFMLWWNCETNQNFRKVELSISAVGEGGFTVAKRGERSSGMEYPYNFPTEGYSRIYRYESSVSNRIFRSTKFDPKAELLMFRVESDDDHRGEMFYGTIERLDLHIDQSRGLGCLDFDYIINKKPNDTVCEYDYD